MAKKFNPMLSGYNNYNYFAFLLLPQENRTTARSDNSKSGERKSHVWVRVCVKERVRVSPSTSLSLPLLAVLRIRKIRIPLPSFFPLAHARTHSHTLSLIFLCFDRIRREHKVSFFSGLLPCLSPGCSQSHDDGLCIPDVNYYIGQQNMQRSIQSSEIINYWGNNNEWRSK